MKHNEKLSRGGTEAARPVLVQSGCAELSRDELQLVTGASASTDANGVNDQRPMLSSAAADTTYTPGAGNVW